MKADRFEELPKDDASDVDIYLPETPFSCNDTRAALSWLVKCDMLAGDAHGGVVIEAAPVGSQVLLSKTYSRHELSDLLGRYHRRLSHMDFRRVAAAFGVTLPPNFEPPLCHSCGRKPLLNQFAQ